MALETYSNQGTSFNVGSTMYMGDYITSANNFMVLQYDGNLCLYKGTSPSNNLGYRWCNKKGENLPNVNYTVYLNNVGLLEERGDASIIWSCQLGQTSGVGNYYHIDISEAEGIDFPRVHIFSNQGATTFCSPSLLPSATTDIDVLAFNVQSNTNSINELLTVTDTISAFVANATSNAIDIANHSTLISLSNTAAITPLQSAVTTNAAAIAESSGVVRHVVLATGQSNMVGYGRSYGYLSTPLNATADPFNVVDPRIWQFAAGAGYSPTTGWNIQSLAGLLVPAFDPLGYPDTNIGLMNTIGIGPATSFCRGLLQDKPPHHHCVIIPLAIGGTGLLQTTAPTTSDNSFPDPRWYAGNPGGSLYENAVSYAKLVISNYNPSSVQIFWIQGEADASAGATSSQYGTGFDGTINGIRSRLAPYFRGIIPVVVGSMNRDYVYLVQGTVPSWLGVHGVHMDTPRRTPFTSFVQINPGQSDITAGNSIHYSAYGARMLGVESGHNGLIRAKLNDPNANVLPSALANVSIPSNTILPTSVNVYWNVSSTHNRITDYVIQYRNVTDGTTGYVNVSHDPFYRPFTIQITTLTANTTFDVRVAAINEAGIGPFTSPVRVTTLSYDQVSNPSTLVTTTTSITLRWVAPATPTIGTITGYRIGYRTSGNGSVFTYATTSATSPYTLTGLTTGTYYDISIAAVSSTSTGPDSFLYNVDTDFFPAGIPLPSIRIRADRGLVFDANGYILTAKDQSGNGRDMTPPVIANTITTPHATVWGTNTPVIQFQPSLMLTATTGFPASSDYTKFALVSFDDFSLIGNLISDPAATTGCHVWWRNAGATITANTIWGGHAGGGFTKVGPTAPLVPGAMYAVALVLSGTTMTQYVNGVQQGASGTGVTACTNTGVLINGFSSAAGDVGNGNRNKAILFEIFPSALTATQIAQLTSYYQVYYNVSLG